jgi:hypothetical protein
VEYNLVPLDRCRQCSGIGEIALIPLDVAQRIWKATPSAECADSMSLGGEAEAKIGAQKPAAAKHNAGAWIGIHSSRYFSPAKYSEGSSTTYLLRNGKACVAVEQT